MKKISLSYFLITVVKPYKGLFFIFGLIALLWALINTLLPYTLKLIIDHVVSFQGNTINLIKSTQPYLTCYITLWIAQCINMRILDLAKLKLFPSLREEIMNKMFGYLNQHSHAFFQNNLAGSLINKIIDMQGGAVDVFTTLDDAFAQALGISFAVIILLFVHPIFSLILLGWSVVFILVTFIFLKPIRDLSHQFAESKTTVVGRMVDSITNIMNVRLFAQHSQENKYVAQSIKEAVQNDRGMQAKIITMRIWWDISIIILISLNIVILLHKYQQHLVTIGDFAFVISLSISILWSLWFLASQFVSFSEKIGICKQALSIISQPHEITDDPQAKLLNITKGKIQFSDVSFHYDKGTRLFKNKNIVIEGGQKVGLVGFTGSGKSTFVNLILRLFEVESGEISIDNQNINMLTQQSLREQIALIPQDIILFHRTLMENIRFGNPNATDNQVIEAAKKAHCHEFIMQIPDGYQSLVGERGIKLSGGQRQRIAIARAMLKNSPILILDEATSSLDSITEKYIQNALDIIMQNKTTIVIAHRLSTLAKMNRILVFDQGKIIEDGSHAELLSKNGHYAKLWKMQAGGFLPEQENEST